MALAQAQALLARLFTDASFRRDYFADPETAGRRFGLSAQEAARLAALDARAVEDFARSLQGKRLLDARKVLPLTARTLGDGFDRMLRALLDGPPAPGRQRADAARLAQHLAAQRDAQPPWIGDLARYECAFAEAAQPKATLIARRFRYKVHAIAAALAVGAPVKAAPRATFGLWLRAPFFGRLRHWMF